LLTQRAELDGKRSQLRQEGQALSDLWEKEQRHPAPEEKIRRDAILNQLDEVKSQLLDLDGEIKAEQLLEADEHDAIARATAHLGGTGGPTPAPGRPLGGTEFSGLGEFLQAVACSASDVVQSRFGERASVLRSKLAAYQAATSGMSSGVPADGGYLVRKDWSLAMMDRTGT